MPALPGPVGSGPVGSGPVDLRAVVLGAGAWGGALAGFLLPGRGALALGGVLLAVLLVLRRRGLPARALVAVLLAAASVAVAAAVRAEANRSGPVADLAARGAYVTVVARVSSDPVLRSGRRTPYVVTRVTVLRVTGRGHTWRTRAPVLVVGDRPWARVRLGARVRAGGLLDRPDHADLAGVLSTRDAPTLVSRPGEVLRAAGAVRAGIRQAVTPAGADERALIPALVVGDVQQMSARLRDDLRTCGLSHLAAVSGTNLTLVVGFLLVLARWAGVRARGLVVIGALGVAGFVVLARPEPSVVRAAAMGSVALLGMGSAGRGSAVRALGAAVLVLLLFDPWLALSVGFALSVLATAGILFLGPPFRDALAGWLPRWAAEAVAVPFAAQLACTPAVAAISGQVSLVAVLANMAVAPAVGPATVLGLAGGLLWLVLPALGHACGWLAGACGWWIVTVAERLARLPAAAVEWGSTPLAVAVLAAVCLVVALLAGRVLARRGWSVCLSVVLVLVLLRPLPGPGWPPDDWVLVACDVGQGDGLVLNAGRGRAVVVDTGPGPAPMRRCLEDLEVDRLPVVVLTHFHADHVDGLPAVLAGWPVGKIEVTALRVPRDGAERVDGWAAAARVPVRVPRYGEVRHVGGLTWQVIGPGRGVRSAGHGEEGSAANNASLVLLVDVRGTRILMSGDMEPEEQRQLHRSLPGLRADVLKVPHHGSRYQDPGLLTGLGARLGLVSVGADNDYGHPAPATLAMLREAGMTVRRTDLSGDIAVVVHAGRLAVRARNASGAGVGAVAG